MKRYRKNATLMAGACGYRMHFIHYRAIESLRTQQGQPQEIFAPVICVYDFDAIDEAINRANALPYAFRQPSQHKILILPSMPTNI